MSRIRLLASGAGAACLLLGVAAGPVHAADPVIAAAGDIACDPSATNFNNGNGTATACRQKYTSDLLVGQGLEAVLALGDVQYEEGTLSEFLGSYDPSWGRVKSITRPVIGNHEYRVGSNGEPPTEGYFDYFNGDNQPSGPAGERGKGYYSFNVGGWHMIALNSMCPEVGGCNAGSVQEQWLRADLAANAGASCTLAYWHHPLFNSGPDGNYKDTPWNTTDLWQALYEAGAEVVMSGHSHRYERFAPQDAFGNASPQYGLREFIVGTGGKSLGNNGPIQPNLEVRDNTQYGVLKLVLHPSSYDWAFVNDSGVTTDSGSTSCHGVPDAAAPDTFITSVTVKKANATFTFTSSETGSTFSCKLDAGPSQPCTSPRSYNGLAVGGHTFQVYATDASGNADPTPATHTFTVAKGGGKR